MELLRLRRAVDAALFFIVLFSSTQGQLKTMNGKIIPWTDPEPVHPRNPTMTIFWDRILNVILNKADAKYGCVPITTGVIIDHNRLLTSHKPFIELSKNLSLIDELIVLVNTGRTVPPKGGKSKFFWNFHQVRAARPIAFDPEPNRKQSTLHDLMVMTVVPNFNRDEKFHWADEGKYMSWYGEKDWLFKMKFAKPGEPLKYPVRYAQLNMLKQKELQFFDLAQSDNFIVDCDEYLPRWWGYFICALDVRGQKGLSSGAMLCHKETLFGVGSFSIKKRDQHILVFTDVRPYYELIQHTMGPNETIIPKH